MLVELSIECIQLPVSCVCCLRGSIPLNICGSPFANLLQVLNKLWTNCVHYACLATHLPQSFCKFDTGFEHSIDIPPRFAIDIASLLLSSCIGDQLQYGKGARSSSPPIVCPPPAPPPPAQAPRDRSRSRGRGGSSTYGRGSSGANTWYNKEDEWANPSPASQQNSQWQDKDCTCIYIAVHHCESIVELTCLSVAQSTRCTTQLLAAGAPRALGLPSPKCSMVDLEALPPNEDPGA